MLPNGKYAVRLFWMGTWRKISVDDQIPVDENNHSLLPICSEPTEIWPVILSKAVLKIAALDFGGGLSSSEFGDPAFILHVLTGWVPYVIYLDNPKFTKKFMWNKLQALLAVNRKSPPEDILSALAVNWDIRTIPAVREWKLENHPNNLQKIDILRMERANAANNLSSAATAMASAPVSSQSTANSLAPKAAARGASAVPRKPDAASPSSLVIPQNPVHSAETPKLAKQRKMPEIFLMATYRSAHHDQPIFDRNIPSRSENLYNNGFLRSESHPVFLRRMRDVYPRRLAIAVIPRYKMVRPLKVAAHRYTTKADGARLARSHPVRYIEFLSLFWRENGRLVHQTPIRAEKLVKKVIASPETEIRFKPTDGYQQLLPPLPEDAAYPRVKKKVIPVEPPPPPPPSPPPTPVHGEKPGKGKGGEAGKGAAVPVLELQSPPPPIRPPAGNAEELQRSTRLSFGSIEFNQFIDSLEQLYILFKPESFDHVASFSYYQPNVVDGRVAVTKKKGGAEPAVQHSVNNVETTRATPKQVVNSVQTKYGKTLLELPSVFLFVDNPYPTNVILCVSTVSRWPYAPRNSDFKSQDRLSVVMDSDDARTPAAEKPYPVIVTAKRHSWLDYSVQPALFTVKTSSVQGVCYHIPAGKHVWRLSVSCPNRKESEPQGFVIKAISKDPVQIGAEEHILKMTGADSYYFTVMAKRILAPLLKWWRINGTPTFAHPPHHEIIKLLGLEEDAPDKNSRGVFLEAMLRGIYNAIQQNLKDFCHPKASMALRAFFSDITTTSMLKFTSIHLIKRDSKGNAPIPLSKADTHGGRATETMKRGKQKNADSSRETKTNPVAPSSLQVEKDVPKSAKSVKQPPAADLTIKFKNTPEAQKAVIMWEMYFFSIRAKAVREARRSGSKKKDAVLKICQEMLEAITKMEGNFSACFLRGLCRNLPGDWLDTEFFISRENRCVYKDVSGMFAEFLPNSWRLIFRETFSVSEPVLMNFRLSISLNCCRLFVVNNDTGEAVPSVLFQPLPCLYHPNEAGYTVVAEAKSGRSPWRGGSWTLRVIVGLDPLKHESAQADMLLPKFSSAAPPVVFLTKEISDYFLPEVNSSTIARVVIKTKTPSNCTISFTTSDPEVLMEVLIIRKQVVMHREWGRGLCIVPSYYFKEDSQSEPYFLQANVLENSWILSAEDRKFCYSELLKRSTVEYGRETPIPIPIISPAKSAKETPGKKGKGKDKDKLEDKLEIKDAMDSARSNRTKDTKEKDKPTVLDTSRPYWAVRFVLDANDADFECKRDTEKDDSLKAMLTAAMAGDSTILQRGKNFRDDYLKRAATNGFIAPDAHEYADWSTNWPRPTGNCLASFDWSAFVRRGSGESSMEYDSCTHEQRIAELRGRYEAAVSTRNEWIATERRNRDEQIASQVQMHKSLLENVVARRLQYMDKRETLSKLLDEQEGRTGIVAPPELPTKTVEKKKKK
ncbi:uncharacterized protein LOC129586906 isoform X2 [Paramacrobiotus metropolitanus]|uniref:uncharacterized protein LOC129586906 isoform X2 n=1 Tax=Paramacrobiotus metropolitanus TaxID=2943436 RepID=UPI00244653F8|nr:uncharacterized protein LOC129586906 isoform X2 [Paramacrobiotus metropolitanus]